MSKRVLVFVYIVVVCYEGTVRSSFLSANTFFLYLRPISSRFFLTWDILLMNKENCALKLVDEIILYYDARSDTHHKKISSFIYPVYNHNWRNINTIYIYIYI